MRGSFGIHDVHLMVYQTFLGYWPAPPSLAGTSQFSLAVKPCKTGFTFLKHKTVVFFVAHLMSVIMNKFTPKSNSSEPIPETKAQH